MECKVQELFNKDQTGKEMYRIVKEFSNDLNGITVLYRGKKVRFPDLSLFQAFDTIRSIPYKQDRAPIEILMRPKYINHNSGADCKKKAILMGSYLKERMIPFRFIAMSNRPDGMIHHVFTQGKIGGEWMNLDPTYDNYKPFEQKFVTRAEVLK